MQPGPKLPVATRLIGCHPSTIPDMTTGPTEATMDPPAVRDNGYYFDDGSVIFRVENTLFKIHATRLTSVSEVLHDMLQLPQSPDFIEGTHDTNPVPLLDVKAEQFRNLLYIFYESPVDPDLIVFMSGASNMRNSSPEAFRRYLDITSLARRYLMQTIESWAYAQLQILSATTSRIRQLPPSHLRDALNYAKIRCSSSRDDEFLRSIRNALACSMCGTPLGGDCLEIYQNPSTADRFLYALSYTCLLSLGYESTQWITLTRDDRAILYASQVRLSPLPGSLPFRPLASVTDIIESVDDKGQPLSLCTHTTSILSSVWVSNVKKWQSKILREGMHKIRALPSNRMELAEAFEAAPCQCAEQCSKKVLAKVDWLVESLLYKLVDFRETLLKNM
ncbi:hypothetical protein FS749_015612 [Ceratobasidium sp. UAMH 11750]|nr:hypothetical protein FS749_015612 [Ceratobasidium sp. UAMH 11750]